MFQRRTCFPTTRHTPRIEYLEPLQEQDKVIQEMEICDQPEFEQEPIMQEKKEIIEQRAINKTKNKEQQKKHIPGVKLLRKLYKQDQLDRSLVRVIKGLSK